MNVYTQYQVLSQYDGQFLPKWVETAQPFKKLGNLTDSVECDLKLMRPGRAISTLRPKLKSIQWTVYWKMCRNYSTNQRPGTRRSEKDNTPQPLDQWTNSPFSDQQVGNCKSFTWPITWPIYLPCTVAQCQSHCASNIICNSHPFHSKWVDPPIPELQQFQYFTFKIQGQGHGWGQSLKSQCESIILSTHILFVPWQSAIPFLRYDFFNIWPWKSKVKVMEEVNIESHNMGPTFYRLTSPSFHVNRPSHS